MKRLIALFCGFCLMLSGCVAGTVPQKGRFTATFLNLFDTVTTIVGYADSKQSFESIAQGIHDELERYHQLFDIYHDYEGLSNLKTVNDQAGIAPVQVDPKIISLLQDCKSYYALTGGRVNVAMGGVLKLWHEARQAAIDDPANAYLPEDSLLQAAAQHWDMDAVILDPQASTVFISDAKVQLDVGAVAKGWAAQQVSEKAPEGLLISVGGNVCATGPKPDGGEWVVGIQNPDGGSEYLHTITVSNGSVVTSGDYQRSYMVDGKSYHHIIDPDTLYPGTYWRSVSIVCGDSGLADALSTALFLLPQAEGQALLDACDAQAMWVDGQGNRYYSSGFQTMIRT